jgi:hypothetical protein
MAAQAIIADKNNELNRHAIRCVQLHREAKEHGAIALAGYIALKDGDGTQAAHFDLMAAQCGIQAGDYADANTAAKALYDEMNSVDGNVNVAAAVQLAGFLGV